MSYPFSRRDFLKVSGLSLAGLAFSRYAPNFTDFDDSNVVRVATQSVSIYNKPTDDLEKATITGTWYKDDLIHVYDQVTAETPELNPVWYRVWGGYVWRGRLQRVKTVLNLPLDSIPEGERLLAEVTVPFTQPWRHTKTYGWQMLDFRLSYESTSWIEAVAEEIGEDDAAGVLAARDPDDRDRGGLEQSPQPGHQRPPRGETKSLGGRKGSAAVRLVDSGMGGAPGSR